MKLKSLFSVLLLMGTLSASATSTPPQEASKAKVSPTQSIQVVAPDWILIINETGAWVIDDGRACGTIIVNTSGLSGVFSECP
jgi:hypothetical protein